MTRFLTHWLEKRRRRRDILCEKCGEPLKLASGAVESSDSGVRVRFEGIPFLACDHDNHPRRFAVDEFGVVLTELLFYPGAAPFPTSRTGSAGGRQICYACGAKVPRDRGRTAVVKGELVVAGLPSFTLAIDGPVSSCGQCGTAQVYAGEETSSAICEAMASAFEQLAIRR